MMVIRLAIVTVVFTLSFSAIFADDACRFEYPGMGVIDLTTLGRTDGHAAYADKTSPSGFNYSMLILFHTLELIIQCLLILEYSYNPCKPFSEGTACENVAACQGG